MRLNRAKILERGVEFFTREVYKVLTNNGKYLHNLKLNSLPEEILSEMMDKIEGRGVIVFRPVLRLYPMYIVTVFATNELSFPDGTVSSLAEKWEEVLLGIYYDRETYILEEGEELQMEMLDV